MLSGSEAIPLFIWWMALSIPALLGLSQFIWSTSSAGAMSGGFRGGGRFSSSSKLSLHLFNWSSSLVSTLPFLSLMGLSVYLYFPANCLVTSYSCLMYPWADGSSAFLARSSMKFALSVFTLFLKSSLFDGIFSFPELRGMCWSTSPWYVFIMCLCPCFLLQEGLVGFRICLWLSVRRALLSPCPLDSPHCTVFWCFSWLLFSLASSSFWSALDGGLMLHLPTLYSYWSSELSSYADMVDWIVFMWSGAMQVVLWILRCLRWSCCKIHNSRSTSRHLHLFCHPCLPLTSSYPLLSDPILAFKSPLTIVMSFSFSHNVCGLS